MRIIKMKDEEKIILIQQYGDCVDHKSDDIFFSYIEKFVHDKDDTVRAFAAEALSRFSNTKLEEKAWKILKSLFQDKNELVRMEAYDSAGCYLKKNADENIIAELENAIITEKNGLARSYAIDSWLYQKQNSINNWDDIVKYLNKILEKESNEHCILNCLYGKYIFGEKNILEEIFKYLNHKDYHIRCSCLSIIQEILNGECSHSDQKKIKKRLENLFEKEKSMAVISYAEEIYKYY